MTAHDKREPAVSKELAQSFGLSQSEWERIAGLLGRLPSYTELGVFSVMWSEHCSYKSSRVHLKRLPVSGPNVVQGPGENAGAVDLGDGFCAVFKMESHNHPSFIEPYQGAATGVGGILRDVFTMGARPVASLNSLRFGSPSHPKTPGLLKGVVAGIGGYGNCIGVPTVGGELQFDSSYDGNILVNAFTLGIARTSRLFFGRAEGIGNPLIYVGAKTGRDGIHGATMASAEFDKASEAKLPTVQVGDPFMEKLLLEACLEIFERDCLEGIQDMGAAGLTSSSVEMAARAGTGVRLDLDRIPRRAKGMTPYELLLSESQERMLLVAKRGREHEIFEVCSKWDLDAVIVGQVTEGGRFVCTATPGHDPLDGEPPRCDPELVVDLPVGALTSDAPQYHRPARAPVARSCAGSDQPTPDPGNAAADLLALLGSPNLGSRQWVWRQYDHVVRDGSVLRPGQADAAVVRVFCGNGPRAPQKYLALSVDCNGRHVKLDPYNGAAMAVAECCRNVACCGAEPLGLTDCLNFGSPENPEVMWQFTRAVDGLRDACLALGVPVVSGNVSFYNETEGQAILPTPTVAVVGQLADPADRLCSAFRCEGDLVAQLGAPALGQLGGSEWLAQRVGRLCGQALAISLEQEARLQRLLLELARARLLRSAHDISDGGFLVCLAECCIGAGLGCALELAPETRAAALFSEEPSRVLVSLPSHQHEQVRQASERHGIAYTELGHVVGHELRIEGVLEVPVADLQRVHAACLDAVVGSAA